ncbi:hypothetical protein DPMN_148102 [Dreissena polymorpha]|uniref:F-box domain-containing protein n=2 Tax=Dreissena polymorpha TaxID=45954 RepID=A0A9D4FDB7_DREPO|nr:hypothetical protein DPMN_148102 [Dreissena polymorpha]
MLPRKMKTETSSTNIMKAKQKKTSTLTKTRMVKPKKYQKKYAANARSQIKNSTANARSQIKNSTAIRSSSKQSKQNIIKKKGSVKLNSKKKPVALCLKKKMKADSSKQKTSRKTSIKSKLNAQDANAASCSSGTKPPSKKRRIIPPCTRKTRAMLSNELGVTRFTLDNVLNCKCPASQHYTFYIDGKKNHGCSCGKRLFEFLKLTGRLESKEPVIENAEDNFAKLSIEILCYIFQFLSLRELLRMESLSTKIQKAVRARLKLMKDIDLMEDIADRRLFEDGLKGLTNFSLMRLIAKLPNVQNIFNFHPTLDGKNDLTLLGIAAALMSSKTLQGIEISNLDLLGLISVDAPHLKILGQFSNRLRCFPSEVMPCNVLVAETKVTSLHLVGCNLFYLPPMDAHLEHLYLRFVKFTNPSPFKDFSAVKLKSFTYAHCIGPDSTMKYIPLLSALADAPGLARLELQGIPFLSGIIQNICEDNWENGGFRRLRSIMFGSCKNPLDSDLGYLIVTSAAYLESLYIQPSLTKDAFFTALSVADVTINPGFEKLCLGWTDTFPYPDRDVWTNARLSATGFQEELDSVAWITDAGMRMVGQNFAGTRTLEISHCPLLSNPILWFTPGQQVFHHVSEVTLRDCHGLKCERLISLLTFLPTLEYLTLVDMFKEPPKGCSRVGLSAGTGLGAATSLMNNTIGGAYVMEPPGGLNNNNHGPQGHQHANNNNNQDHHGNPGQNPAHDNQGQGHEDVDSESSDSDSASENEGDEDNATNRNAARNEGGYNLRTGPRGSSSTSSQDNNGSDLKKQSRRASQRLSSRRSNSDLNSPGLSRVEASPGGRESACASSSRGTGQSKVVSKKGKALVTRHGLVSKVKSSVKQAECEEVTEKDTASPENSVLTKKKGPRACICKKVKQDIGCQVNYEEIKNSRQQISKARVKKRSRDKIIVPGKFQSQCAAKAPVCPRHKGEGHFGVKVRTCDKNDSTRDPVWEEDERRAMVFLHRRLCYLQLDNVGITDIDIVCYNLKTLTITRCATLKVVTFKEASFLENVHVSQCRKLEEELLLESLYKLPPNRSKFVSLRPMHYTNENLFHDLMFYNDFLGYNFGTLMMFDYSATPSHTAYNKHRMKSWKTPMEKLAREVVDDYGWCLFHQMDPPNKGLFKQNGKSIDGSEWSLHMDVPWINMLSQCEDMESQNIQNKDWLREGVYCPEAKGHFSFSDIYGDLQDQLEGIPPDQAGLYMHNILTYVNMCDISGVPKEDALSFA